MSPEPRAKALLVPSEATGQEADLLGSASQQTLTLHHTHLHNLVVGLTDWGRRHAGSGLTRLWKASGEIESQFPFSAWPPS